MTKKFLPATGFAVLALALTTMLSTTVAEPAPSKPVLAAHPQEKDLAPAKLQYYWKRELPLTGTERVARLYAMDENLYLMMNNHYVRAVDAAVGNPKWIIRVGSNGHRVFEPTHVPDMRLPERMGTIDDIEHPETVADFDTFNAMLVNSMTDLVVVDRKSGKVYRDIHFKNIIATDAGVSDGKTFYVGNGEKHYCAIKLLPDVMIWNESLGQIVSTPMRYFDGRIYMGTLDGLLRCADVNNYGRKRWQRKFDGSFTQKFHVDDRGLFIACNDRRIYAFNAYSGEKLWSPVVVKGTVGGPLQMGEKTLFQYIQKDGLYAVNLSNGDVRWKKPTGRKVLAMIDDVVYVLDNKQKLHLVNEVTGKETAVIPFGGFDFYALNTASPAIYTGTKAGQLFCIRPVKAGRLTVEMLKK